MRTIRTIFLTAFTRIDENESGKNVQQMDTEISHKIRGQMIEKFGESATMPEEQAQQILFGVHCLFVILSHSVFSLC